MIGTYIVYIVQYVCGDVSCFFCYVFFFKQKTAYEMRISDWSSDVCSSDLGTWNESGGRADRLRWHGGIVRTGYDERWRFDLRKKASRVMALDRCDSAGESGNCRGQDHRLSKIQQTLVDRSGKPCRIHDRHLRNE